MSFTAFTDEIDKERTVSNASFFPDINVSDFVENYRIPAEYTQNMIENRIVLAMLFVNVELSAWKLEKEQAGATTLDEIVVEGEDYPEEMNPLVIQYTRAVSCRAKALLLADFATMIRKSDAVNDALESEDTADVWYGFASDAINDIKGTMKIKVALL